MDALVDRGAPAGTAEPKRVANKVPVRVDWHDYLINRREPGTAVALNFVFRPSRSKATGLEYKCTNAGVTSRMPFDAIKWPTIAGGAVTDGVVVWTAQAVSVSSLRATANTEGWSADTGVTLSNPSNNDLVYTTFVAGGANGSDYEIKHSITLTGTPGELAEALIVLPVRD